MFNVFLFRSFSILETTLLKGEEKTAQTLQVSIRSKMGLTDDSTRKIQGIILNQDEATRVCQKNQPQKGIGLNTRCPSSRSAALSVSAQ